MRERIRVIGNKLDHLNRKKAQLNADLNSRGFRDDIKTAVTEHLAKSREKTFQDVRTRQQVKFDRLKDKQSRKEGHKTNLFSTTGTVDLSGTQLKRWVVNLSKYKVTDAQNKALSHGLNFAVSPDNVHESGIINECIIACEKACWKLPAGEASQLRAEVVGTIKSSKIPKPNVSKE